MISKIYRLQSENREINQLQLNIINGVNALIGLPLNQGTLIQEVDLVTGANVVNHTLGRALVGWILTRVRANATVFDTQDLNPNPGLTLFLTASADVTVDLWCF